MADLINYKAFKNDRFQVLTDDGFKDFKGIMMGENHNKVLLEFDDGKKLICTPKHKVMVDHANFKYAKDLEIGDSLFGGIEIISISTFSDDSPVYEFIDIEDVHTYFSNGILSHQCLLIDEAAHIEEHILEPFYASVFPIISSSKKAKVIMCSTPKGTGNLFHKKYTQAVEGATGWGHDKILWNEVPGRTQEWADEIRRGLASEEMWRQEFECCGGESLVDIESLGFVSIKQLYDMMD